ncbi:hypothetical protein [Geopsychrobacter electrodiphilus]|uniref:hypothetical protein n=1 Tax=Geopsychrobacter electrodiphilus TaxID=225196 RepID=UPI0003817BF3|nr:hypothetical protein [Geopsychrobacter electrodiphilus]
MTLTLYVVALFWGLAAGYLLLRGLDSLLGLGYCVHGLFAWRWKTLVNKNATGLIRPGLIVKLALRLGVYTLLAGVLLDMGAGLVGRNSGFSYVAPHGVLFACAGIAMWLGQVRTSTRRLRLVWRMSHEFDFAARRERTQRLKS